MTAKNKRKIQNEHNLRWTKSAFETFFVLPFFPLRLQLIVNNQAGHWFPLGEGESTLLLLRDSNLSASDQSQRNHLRQRLPADQMVQSRKKCRNHCSGGTKRSHQNRPQLQEPRVRAQPPRGCGRRDADYGQTTCQRHRNLSLRGDVRYRGHPRHNWPRCQRWETQPVRRRYVTECVTDMSFKALFC